MLSLAIIGMNTKSSLMTIRMKTNDANRANRLHIFLTSEQLMEVSGSGITVYD
jgi:hypothetical protein